jgi:hypothetical protein
MSESLRSSDLADGLTRNQVPKLCLDRKTFNPAYQLDLLNTNLLVRTYSDTNHD